MLRYRNDRSHRQARNRYHQRMTPQELAVNTLPITGEDAIVDLTSLLDAQVAIYDDMLEVARGRFAALAANDVEALGSLVGREGPMLASLRRLDSARLMVLRPLATRLGVDVARLTVSRIAEEVGPERALPLVSSRDRLVAVATRVQDANEQNRRLLEACLDSVNDLAQSLLQAIETNPQYGSLVGGGSAPGAGDPPRLADLRA
ncbi:MAG: flagellar protein FlgN [Proteobacteria bacterium]|nr:flagellar protein FlgN [Pseudomonadota bacterium]